MAARPGSKHRAAEARAVRREMERFVAEHRDELASVPHVRDALAAYRHKLDALESRGRTRPRPERRLRAVR